MGLRGCAVWVLVLALLTQQAVAQSGPLRVGAARVSITPPDVDPATVRDSLYVRAVVIDDGESRAALISADQSAVGESVYVSASQEIAAMLDVPVENIAISATHTHSAGGANSFRSSPLLSDAIVEAVRQANDRLQPAEISYGVGAANLNVNRDAIHPETRLWYQGPNLEGVSDKSLPVIGFWTTDGEPIAAYYSYAMHPVNFYNTGFTSADFSGEAARHIETIVGPDFVTLFVQAPSGDQNPLYTWISSPVPAPVEQVPVGAAGQPDGESEPASLRVVAGIDEFVRAAGVILGQEVLRVMYTSSRLADARIDGAQTIVTCPGRTRLDSARQGVPGEYTDGPDVNIRVGALRIGSVALLSVNAEVYTDIGLRLKRESPLANVMPITLTNGSAGSGYIPDDASFYHYTFQVLGSRLKPGCAESGIAHAALELVAATGGL